MVMFQANWSSFFVCLSRDLIDPNGPVTVALEICKLVQQNSEFAISIMEFALVVGFLSFCCLFCFPFTEFPNLYFLSR